MSKITKYIGEVRAELQKATWPWESKEKERGFKRFKELTDSTIVVLIAMLLLGGYVAFWDIIMLNVMKVLTL
ncbi:MAG: preprotein translocase subunit SecE [Verrucomicrobiota bacterium]